MSSLLSRLVGTTHKVFVMTLITNKCLLSTAGAVSHYSVCVCQFVVRTNQDNGLKNFRVENDHAGAVSGMQKCVVNKPKLTTHYVFKAFHTSMPRHSRQQD